MTYPQFDVRLARDPINEERGNVDVYMIHNANQSSVWTMSIDHLLWLHGSIGAYLASTIPTYRDLDPDKVADARAHVRAIVPDYFDDTEEIGHHRLAAAKAAGLVTRADMVQQVAGTLPHPDSVEGRGIDVDAIVWTIIVRYGLIDIDTIDSAEYWEIVRSHDATQQRTAADAALPPEDTWQPPYDE